MLAKFRAAKEKELEHLRKAASAGLLQPPLATRRRSLASALKESPDIAVIAEYKRASPSLGKIRDDLEIEEAANSYDHGGATAISILTEERYFDGSLDYIDRAREATSLPLLRKDFIFDELQIAETASTHASALLLIVRLTPDPALLRSLRERAERYGLEAVVEIFDLADLELARESGAPIIQVNARDLDRLQVNRQAALKLIEAACPHKDEVWIAASGIANGMHLREAANAGFDAALIGSSLMAKGNPGENLAALVGESKCF